MTKKLKVASSPKSRMNQIQQAYKRSAKALKSQGKTLKDNIENQCPNQDSNDNTLTSIRMQLFKGSLQSTGTSSKPSQLTVNNLRTQTSNGNLTSHTMTSRLRSHLPIDTLSNNS